jgi:hypothetical protein
LPLTHRSLDVSNSQIAGLDDVASRPHRERRRWYRATVRLLDLRQVLGGKRCLSLYPA